MRLIPATVRRDPVRAAALAGIFVGLAVVIAVTGYLLRGGEGGAFGTARLRVTLTATHGVRGDDRLQRPVGVTSHGDGFLVTDVVRGEVVVFDAAGSVSATWGADVLGAPAFIAFDPASGGFVVSDRETKSIHRFSSRGSTMGALVVRTEVDATSAIPATVDSSPSVVANEQGSHDATIAWEPVAVAFGDDGRLFATDLQGVHHLVVADPERDAYSLVATSSPDLPLSYPSGIAVRGDEVWVADSNGLRIVVYDRDGAFQREIPLDFAPRGITFAPVHRRFGGTTGAAALPVVVDTMGSRLIVLSEKGGDVEVTYGDGSLSHPNGITATDSGEILVADTGGARVRAFRLNETRVGRGLIAGLPAAAVIAGFVGLFFVLAGSATLIAMRFRRTAI